MERMWRLLLPGLAFQAVLIGGGYATGRELVSFYYSSGPLGGLLSMGVTTLIWSVTMMVVLEFARSHQAYEYKKFFKELIGPGWLLFELAYFALLIVVLSVVGAAAGEILNELTGWPTLVGTTLLIVCATFILLVDGDLVKHFMSLWSVGLYVCYTAFFLLFFYQFGGESLTALQQTPLGEDIFLNGLKYAGVNINCFVGVLFLVGMLENRKEAFLSGALVGPIAMIPGMMFFFTMAAFFPQLETEVVPLTFILNQLNAPIFKLIFQVAILGTLLQTGVGMLHAVNERIQTSYNRNNEEMPHKVRGAISLLIMLFSITIAEWVGLVSLIDNGYGALSWVFIVLIFVPVFTVGLRLILHPNSA